MSSKGRLPAGSFEIPTLAAGQFWSLSLTADGSVRVVTSPPGASGAPSTYSSAGLAASGVARATPGLGVEVRGYNGGANARYFMLFDAAAVPANGTVPSEPAIKVPTDENFSVTFAEERSFLVGLVWASSSTPNALTLTAAPDLFVNIDHRAP